MRRVPASFARIGDEEKKAMHEVVDAGWLTASNRVRQFEGQFARITESKHAITTNSGSSANLLAVAAMVENGLWKEGDIILTVAASFPTTVNPLLLYGLIPHFVDIDLPAYNVNVDQLWRASSDRKCKGIMLAHTMGNPFDLVRVTDIADQRKLNLIEDCCDALGATYDGQHVGTFGAAGTCSFFPAHHITTGEGGAVFTDDEQIRASITSIRDWGRDCWCDPGQENSCGKRFDWEWGALPAGFDHKYTYSRLGYNLKMTEVQAACGLAQMQKLPSFIEKRRLYWKHLRHRLDKLSDRLILPEPTEGADPSWFGFVLTLREPGLRSAMQQYLDQQAIGSRLLFGGNITKQPYMKGRKYLVSGDLKNSDKVMNDTLWVGCHPHLDAEDLDHLATHIETFMGEF